MPVTHDKIVPYLKDYERVFGVRADQFFCPLTRQFKPLDELIYGHVFSEQFRCSKDIRVVQWGKIDHWFGSTYESHLLKFWNRARLTPEERLAEGDFYIGLSKGLKPFAPNDREYRAYLKDSIVGKQFTSNKSKLDLWTVTIDTPVGPREFIVKGLTDIEKPKSGCVYLFERATFVPMMVSAAMMKAGLLTLFWLMGYACLRSRLISLVGERIKLSYESQAKEQTAYRFWAEFENAYALIESGRHGVSGYVPWHFNTITTKNAIELHRNGIQFAFNFIYDVGGVTVQVTFPFTPRNEDTDTALNNYFSFLRREFRVDQAVQSQWDGHCWQPVGTVRYMDEPSIVDHARQLVRGFPPRKEAH